MPIPIGVLAQAGAGGGGGNGPTSIQPLAWWDFSSSDYLTISSGKITQANDRSNQGRHLKQTTSTNQPTHDTNAINGLSAAGFSGNQWMTPDNTFTIPNAISIFIVFKTTTLAEKLITGSDSYQADFQLTGAGAPRWQLQGGAGSAYLQGGAANTDWRYTWMIRGQATETYAGFISPNTTLTQNITLTIQSMTTPGKYWVGTRNDLALPFNGQIAEVIYYGQLIEGTDRTDIVNYITTKYGI